jgi:hypothetical protein
MGRHKSLDKHVKQSMNWVKKLDNVTKIVIGISKCCRHKYPPGNIRVRIDVDAGIKVNAYSGNGVTDIFIKIDPITEREKIKKIIQDKFQR